MDKSARELRALRRSCGASHEGSDKKQNISSGRVRIRVQFASPTLSSANGGPDNAQHNQFLSPDAARSMRPATGPVFGSQATPTEGIGDLPITAHGHRELHSGPIPGFQSQGHDFSLSQTMRRNPSRALRTTSELSVTKGAREESGRNLSRHNSPGASAKYRARHGHFFAILDQGVRPFVQGKAGKFTRLILLVLCLALFIPAQRWLSSVRPPWADTYVLLADLSHSIVASIPRMRPISHGHIDTAKDSIVDSSLVLLPPLGALGPLRLPRASPVSDDMLCQDPAGLAAAYWLGYSCTSATPSISQALRLVAAEIRGWIPTAQVVASYQFPLRWAQLHLRGRWRIEQDDIDFPHKAEVIDSFRNYSDYLANGSAAVEKVTVAPRIFYSSQYFDFVLKGMQQTVQNTKNSTRVSWSKGYQIAKAFHHHLGQFDPWLADVILDLETCRHALHEAHIYGYHYNFRVAAARQAVQKQREGSDNFKRKLHGTALDDEEMLLVPFQFQVDKVLPRLEATIARLEHLRTVLADARLSLFRANRFSYVSELKEIVAALLDINAAFYEANLAILSYREQEYVRYAASLHAFVRTGSYPLPTHVP